MFVNPINGAPLISPSPYSGRGLVVFYSERLTSP